MRKLERKQNLTMEDVIEHTKVGRVIKDSCVPTGKYIKPSKNEGKNGLKVFAKNGMFKVALNLDGSINMIETFVCFLKKIHIKDREC